MRFSQHFGTMAALLGLAFSCPLAAHAAEPNVRCEVRAVSTGGRAFRCKVVRIHLTGEKIQAHVITASGGIGRTESFAAMVRRSGALAAINGSFFEAYRPIGDQDPVMTLLHRGEMLHTSDVGCVLGFGNGKPVIGRLFLDIQGTVTLPSGRSRAWYCYGLNHNPVGANSVMIYTRARGARTRITGGISIVVENDVVTQIVSGDVAIPPRGYVINCRGVETVLAERFVVGAQVHYEIQRRSDRDTEVWQNVTEAVGAGPRLLTDGHITCLPQSEGFRDPKIVLSRGRRSAIGITRDGNLILVSVDGPTMLELADLMRQLGAVQAMNMDGGASAGLYGNGQMFTLPGRLLSNALVFIPKAPR